ncbi:release factor glutamine methyltransferase [Arenicella chitinivorans]|uniref:Release factor glutamine methyltransferase n=1 Tax=Arenicella chitinivorans TaxID=1329800 RepID=A0A918RPJ6_9GAMM|nr:peptide chain release factor N(5)-glutamine methyltransferase [Arenicella chitinivorans]GHA06584.1 release factor glutamine methyltransferase [Arenicella chitinivorans]
MSTQPVSYKQLIELGYQRLFDSSDTPRIDAEYLLQHVTGQSMAWLIAWSDSFASTNHVAAFLALLAQREQGTPIAYLIGERDFWTLTLTVNRHVLIPRPDTEALVECALNKLPTDQPLRLLDLGTGSGAIALALAKERPLASVFAVDSQADALAVANHNAERNAITNATFLQSDWFEQIEGRFDLIASNPPYVAPGDPHLSQGDLRFEPDSALSAANNGLADLESIIQSAPDYLHPNGWLVVEHGFDQAEAVRDLFTLNHFREIHLHSDLNELPRCTAGRRS